jgi:hypothetical protein
MPLNYVLLLRDYASIYGLGRCASSEEISMRTLRILLRAWKGVALKVANSQAR